MFGHGGLFITRIQRLDRDMEILTFELVAVLLDAG